MSAGTASFIPGEVSVDILEALRVAIAQLPRPRNVINQNYLDGLRKSVNAVRPDLVEFAGSLPRPVRLRLVKSSLLAYENFAAKRIRIKRELLEAHVTLYGLLKSESRHLPNILHDNEHVEAVIYGQHGASSAMLVATDERIIYLDKKPMVVLFDEVSYEVVSGVEFDIHTLFATVILHTPVKNYDFRFTNLHCAENFVRYIERQRLEKEDGQENHREVIDLVPYTKNERKWPSQLGEDMAGYYWLPLEDEEGRRT